MSFTLEIKKEILKKELTKKQSLNFISGLIAIFKTDLDNKNIIKINNQNISNSILNLLKKMKIKTEQVQKNKNFILIKDFIPLHHIENPTYFFMGVFLGGGSISNPNSSNYHLEIQFLDKNISSKVKNYLNKYDFSFIQIKRRNNWVLYLKKSELITDFLRFIKTFNSLMDFENIRINRDFKNQLNRFSNLDTYNQNKLVKSTQKFLKMYNILKNEKLFHLFNEKELIFFEIKKNNPYSSLEELTKIYYKKTKIKKTKSGLNHYIYKIKKIIKDNKL